MVTPPCLRVSWSLDCRAPPRLPSWLATPARPPGPRVPLAPARSWAARGVLSRRRHAGESEAPGAGRGALSRARRSHRMPGLRRRQAGKGAAVSPGAGGIAQGVAGQLRTMGEPDAARIAHLIHQLLEHAQARRAPAVLRMEDEHREPTDLVDAAELVA